MHPSLIVVLASALALAACGGGASAGPDGSAAPGSPSAGSAAPWSPSAGSAAAMPDRVPMPDGSPDPSPDLAAVLCERIVSVLDALARVQAVELRPTAKTSLDIEFGRVDSAFTQLRQTDLGEARATLAAPLRRLGYRVEDLRLAVEDFRTTSRPREAAAHVEQESEALGDALAGFFLLAGC